MPEGRGVFRGSKSAKYANIPAVAVGDYTPSASLPPLYERGIFICKFFKKIKRGLAFREVSKTAFSHQILRFLEGIVFYRTTMRKYGLEQ